MAANEIAVVENAERYRELMKTLEQKAIKALPRFIHPDRFIQLAIVTGTRTKNFFRCTPASVVSAMMTSAELGLVPGPTLGLLYFIPRKNKHLRAMHDGRDVYECTVLIGYKGYAELARRSGEVAFMDADVVYKGDKFEIKRGLYPDLVHVPDYDSVERSGPPQSAASEEDDGPPPPGSDDGPSNRPEDLIRGAYAVVGLQGVERPLFVYLPIREILKRRARSSSRGSDSPWNTDFAAMCRKTAILALLKGGLVPLSTDVQVALERDPDAQDYEVPSIDPSEEGGEASPPTSSPATRPRGGFDRLRRALHTTQGSPLDPMEPAGEETGETINEQVQKE